MGYQRVGHKGALPILDGQRHGIVNVNFLRKNTAVPIISILRLTSVIHFFYPGHLTVFEDIFALLGIGTIAAPFSSFFAGSPIKPKRAVGIDFFWFLSDKPIDNIKMMSGFMYQKTPTVFQLPVPSAEIIRAVNRVQHPLKMHIEYFPHHILFQQFFHPGKQRHISAIKCHCNPPSIALLRVQNGITAIFIHGHWLLTDDIHSPVQSFYHILAMKTIHCGDYGTIRLDFLHHFVKICINRHIIRNQAFHIFPALAVYIHNACQMRHIIIPLRNGRRIHPITSSSGSNQNIFFH